VLLLRLPLLLLLLLLLVATGGPLAHRLRSFESGSQSRLHA